jgi:hypothetical protein
MAPPAANPTDPTLYTTAKRGSPALPPPERPTEGERSGETAVARWIGGEISEIALCYCAGEGDVLGSVVLMSFLRYSRIYFSVDWKFLVPNFIIAIWINNQASLYSHTHSVHDIRSKIVSLSTKLDFL